jgi:hypothetical protein
VIKEDDDYKERKVGDYGPMKKFLNALHWMIEKGSNE